MVLNMPGTCVRDDPSAADIGVVVCAYTEERWDALAAALASIKGQTCVPREIVVVVDHNPALHARARAAFAGPGIRVIENTEPRGLSGARNTGLAATRAAVVAFLDDDAVAEPSWLARLSAGYADAAVIAVGGLVEPVWESGSRPIWFPEEFGWVVGCSYRGLPTSSSPVRNLIGCNMSFRREVFERLGGFHGDVGRLGMNGLGDEETELCVRALRARMGLVLHLPAARVRHAVPASRARLRYFCRRCYAEGLSKARLTRLVGAADGLSSERRYVARVLPRGVVEGLADTLLRRKPGGAARAGAILLGLVVTGAGYLVGRLAEARSSWGRGSPTRPPALRPSSGEPTRS
jgi:GT2 family glycosyltransferase